MAKLTDEMIDEIRSKCEDIKYGKVTICMNETTPTIDIVAEERKQFSKEIKPRPGVVVAKNYRQG